MTSEPSRAPRIGAVVLAADLSSRTGVDKLLMPLWGKPLVRHAVEAAVASRAAAVVVVTGDRAREVEASLDGLPVNIVENKEYSGGSSTSLKCGLKALPADCDGAVILLGDMPLVVPSLIDGLIAAFDPAEGRAIVVPVRSGRRGNPVLWARRFFPELFALEGDKGAKDLMVLHRDQIHELEAADDGPLIDIDTPEALAAETLGDPLYTTDVLRLAAEARGAGRLPVPHGTHTEHNPACGDRSTVDLTVVSGRVAAIAHDTKACVLAQASASILGAALPGRSYDDLVKLKAQVADMFENRKPPAEPFSPYAVLSGVALYLSRQKCVLLPIEAARKAFEASQVRKPSGQRT